MRRVILSFIALFCFTLSWAQIVVGSRDNQYVYGEYQYKGWSVKLEESVYAEKIGHQYLRLYAGYAYHAPQWSLSAQPYFGASYNGNYCSLGGYLTGKYHLLDKYHFKAILNPHYDSGYKYETNYLIGMGMDLSSQIGIKLEYQEMPIYRMKEKRMKGGFIFKTGNLSVSPQISVPTEGATKNIRCIVDFRYSFPQ